MPGARLQRPPLSLPAKLDSMPARSICLPEFLVSLISVGKSFDQKSGQNTVRHTNIVLCGFINCLSVLVLIFPSLSACVSLSLCLDVCLCVCVSVYLCIRASVYYVIGVRAQWIEQ